MNKAQIHQCNETEMHHINETQISHINDAYMYAYFLELCKQF